ncbi:tetratricopeptide repeat protein [Myroides pelagicus]|uniref:Tetratricopeptide repeat protein n=1 Tax=Myroides pelagicus TaxID=270914 RepID=A0A7K1GKK8_9FLAO|nr:tetratricopeptide repeat protein [Myroides pelagicus]MEC4113225.1 tetratricopeptide repeat protein [Myroides pelagicus]MTH29391.1 tetratricopeptide repeat protein [Myroides pelagicus]
MNYFFYIFLFLLPISINAQDKEHWDVKFENANSLYVKENYAKAIEIYRDLIKERDNSPEVYYNLANAYYKLHSYTESIYYYEKSLKLDPTKQAYTTNLNYARKNLQDDISITKDYTEKDIVHQGLSLFTVNQWTVISTIATLLIFAVFVLYYISTTSALKRLWFTSLIILVIVSIGSAYSAYFENNYKKYEYSAIIFDSEIDFKTEAKNTSETIQQLHEGTRVHIIGEKGIWINIKLDNQEEGWIEKSSIRKI